MPASDFIPERYQLRTHVGILCIPFMFLWTHWYTAMFTYTYIYIHYKYIILYIPDVALICLSWSSVEAYWSPFPLMKKLCFYTCVYIVLMTTIGVEFPLIIWICVHLSLIKERLAQSPLSRLPHSRSPKLSGRICPIGMWVACDEYGLPVLQAT